MINSSTDLQTQTLKIMNSQKQIKNKQITNYIFSDVLAFVLKLWHNPNLQDSLVKSEQIGLQK